MKWQEMLAMARQPTLTAFLVSLTAIEFVRAALFITLLPIYLPERWGFSAAAVGGILCVQYMADTLLRMWVGSLIDCVGAWPVLLPGFALTAASVWLLPHIHALALLLFVALAFGGGAAGTWPATVFAVMALAPQRGRAMALSLVFFSWLVSGGFGLMVINVLSPQRAFLLLGLVSLVPLATLLGSSIWPFYGAALVLAAMTVLYALLPLERFSLDEVQS